MLHTGGIVVTTQDFERLQSVLDIEATSAIEHLEAELARAQLVPSREVAEDVVTMNSDVVYEDAVSRVQRTVRVVYPKDVDAKRGWVSVLAPLGSALLGLRVGQAIDWTMPGGVRRLRIISIPYQPEANGAFWL
jgi:regulator of nucleoside diphosphate kinase